MLTQIFIKFFSTLGIMDNLKRFFSLGFSVVVDHFYLFGAARTSTYSLAFLRGFNEDGTFERLVSYLMNPCRPPAILPETRWEEINKTNHGTPTPEQT